MAQECGFFNAQQVGDNEYDRVYLAEQFAAYFASFIGNGIFGQSMQKLEVVEMDEPEMAVKVLSGEAWINGWWYRNTDDYMLQLNIADGVLGRIDSIVIRWGRQERDIWLQVVEGIPSLNPAAPEIRRDADYYDLQLATVEVERGAIVITQSAIKDTRLDNSVCGLVTGVVDQIDTTGLYNQFESYFKEFKERHVKEYDEFTSGMEKDYVDWTNENKAKYEEWYRSHTQQWSEEFIYWFDNVKQVLSDDAAYQLYEQIVALDERIKNAGSFILMEKVIPVQERKPDSLYGLVLQNWEGGEE